MLAEYEVCSQTWDGAHGAGPVTSLPSVLFYSGQA